MNNLFRKSSPLFKKILKIQHYEINFQKYLKLSPKFSSKFRLVKEPSFISKNDDSKNIKEKLSTFKQPNFDREINLQNMKYPLIITSPLITGMSLIFLQGIFIGAEIPELSKFIFKSSFLYSTLFAGLSIGIKFQSDEKVNAVNFSAMKKKIILLSGIFGISQMLGMVSMPLSLFVGFYTVLYGLVNGIMQDIHEELDDMVTKTKIIMMLIGLFNLIFICNNYSDFRESLKDAENFDKLFEAFLSSNDDKFESEIIDKDKCLRAVDYRLFKINNAEI